MPRLATATLKVGKAKVVAHIWIWEGFRASGQLLKDGRPRRNGKVCMARPQGAQCGPGGDLHGALFEEATQRDRVTPTLQKHKRIAKP